MFIGRTAATVIVTPQDEIATPGLVETMLARLFALSTGPIVVSEFGATLDVLYEGMGNQLAKGGYLFGVFDVKEYLTPSEQKPMKQFQAKYPACWKEQLLVAGTSMEGHQILHDKKAVFNAPLNGFEPATGDWDTPEEAMASGGAVSWFGSYNLSPNAARQANTVCIMPGLVVATMFVTDIVANHEWIVANQQKYQPYPTGG